MILYFADRKMNIVGTAFTDKGDGYICYNDKETSEVDTGTVIFTANVAYPAGKREEALNRVKSGNYLFVANNDGNATFYTIIDIESSTLDRSIYIYAEDAGLDLLNNIVEAKEVVTQQTLEEYLIPLIRGTNFERGEWETPYSEILNDQPRLALSFGEQTAKERLLKLCEAFDVEFFFTFKIEGMQVTHKYLNIKQKRGENNYVHLTIGREVSDIRVKQSVSDLATALKPFGSKPEGSIGVKTYTEPLSSGGYRQYYMWLKFISYNDDGIPSMSDGTSGAKFILNSRVDQFDPVESDDASQYSAKRFNHKGIYIIKPKSAGFPEFKEKSTDSQKYTWIRFSQYEDGRDLTASSWQFTYGTSKYIGIATGKDKSTPTNDPQDYRWTDISYAIAENQIVIVSGNGAGVLTEGDNITTYVWVKYSANANGSNMTDVPSLTTKYVGLCYGRGATESTSASDYEWLPLEQASGDGNGYFTEVAGGVNRGLPYTTSKGELKYIHYRFAGDENGNDISTEANGSYIGISLNNDYPTPMSMVASKYVWSPVDGVKIDKIDLVGYEYTEKDEDGEDDIYVEDGIVKSYKALKEWGRFVTDENSSAHIVRYFNYDTQDRHTLLEETVKELKKVREPSVTYEVSLIYMPEGLSLGDTVYVTDPEGALYLEARLLKLEKEYCNKQITATFGDYKVVENDLAEELNKLKAQVEKQLENLTTYTWVVYADDTSGTGMSLNSEGKRWMGIATNKLTKTPDLTNPFIYSWSKLSVREESFTIYYYGVSNSPNTVPTTWTQDNIEPDENNPYMWSKGTRYFNDGSSEMVPPHIIGVFGKGIRSIDTYYGLSQVDNTEPIEWIKCPPGDVPVITSTDKFLWSYEVITYTDNTKVTSSKKIIGAYGKDGITITSDDNYYLRTTTQTTPTESTSGWEKNPDSIPVLTSTYRYLWTYEIVKYSDGNEKKTPIHLIGVYGEKGAQGQPGTNGKDGKDGKYVTKQYTEYYLSSSSTAQEDGAWQTTPREFRRGWYYWIRTVTEFSVGDPEVSEPVLDMYMTTSNEYAINARDTADGKGTIFYQPTAPSTLGRNSNDIWFDTDDGNSLHRFKDDTKEWVKIDLGDGAVSITASDIKAGTIDCSKGINVTNLNAGAITSGTLSANYISGGILKDLKGNFSFDLSEGTFSLGGLTDRFIFGTQGIVVKGTTQSGFLSRFSDTALEFYKGGTVETKTANITGGVKQAWVDSVDGLGVPKISIGLASNRNKRWMITTQNDGDDLIFSRIIG